MSYQSEVLADDPDWYLRLEEPSGAFADSSGNGVTVSETGLLTRSVAGAMPSSVGVASDPSDTLTLGYAALALTAETIEVWLRTTTTGQVLIEQNRFGSGVGVALQLNIGSTGGFGAGAGQVSAFFNATSFWLGIHTSGTVNDGAWHHVVATWSGTNGVALATSQMKIYVDGALASTVADSGNTGSRTAPVSGDGNMTLFNAGAALESDEMAFYSGALSAGRVAAHYAAAVSEPIPEPPPYVPPIPGGALIEIRAASPGSYRWGIALWGVGTWSAAGWQDVTPQSVDAIVRWGSHQPGAGVLAETEAGSYWIVDTYDPERLLDPGNPDGPYHADLRAGLPIRIRHRGTIIRQGVAESILFQHADTVGGIRVTDAVSILARTPVPEDSVLSDTLRARARDAIAAAGLRVTVEPDPPTGDPALAPRLENERSVWRHIADAAQQVLHMPYVDRVGTLRFRPWATPYDRGRGVDDTQLVDLGTLVTTAGLYSVVRAQQTVGDGDLLIERRLTPVPRYGPVTYERSDATPDAGAWADAVLADRSLQTVQWLPGAIFPLTADDVEYFATLEGMERFGVDDDAAEPPVDITGVIVGGEIRITAKRDSAAVWGFDLELAQTADSPLYFDDTDPPEFMLNETGDGYLYGD